MQLRRLAHLLLLNRVVASECLPKRWRPAALRRLGVDVERANVFPGVTFLGTADVSIGHNAMLNRGVTIDRSAPVLIGPDVHLAHDVLIVTGTHELATDSRRRAGDRVDRGVSIESGSWLGARVTVLPGVRIGRGSVIAAGAVVAEDVPPDCLYGGVPARLIRVLA